MSEHFGAEERPAAQLVDERRELRLVRVRCDAADRLALRALALDVGGDGLGEHGEPSERALECAPRQREPPSAVGGELVDPRDDGCGRPRIKALGQRRELTLGDADDLDALIVEPPKPRPLEDTAEVAKNDLSIVVVGRKMVHDHKQRETASGDALQHVERDLIGVTRCGGHEHAEVCRLDEHVGDGAVRAFDRIEIGRVDDGDTWPRTIPRRPDQPRGRDPSERPTRERLGIGVRREQHSLARGRTQHAGRTDGRPRERVH